MCHYTFVVALLQRPELNVSVCEDIKHTMLLLNIPDTTNTSQQQLKQMQECMLFLMKPNFIIALKL